jgi:type II secretory ATPase GspE/PulE/Tfp pilus assembly ATPase PilB-like protein
MAVPQALLTQNALFSCLDRSHVEQLAPHFSRHEIPPHTEIVQQGQPGDSLFLIESGVIGVYRRDPKVGTVQLVAQLEAPESFGEMALVTGETRTATCVALEPVVAYRLASEVFHAVVQQAPAVALGVARVLSDRLARMTAENDIPWTSLAGRAVDARLWALVTDAQWTRARAVPIALVGRALSVGLVDPLDLQAVNALRAALPSFRVKIHAISANEVDAFVAQVRASKPAVAASRDAVVPPASRPQLSFVEDEDARAGRPSLVQPSGQQVLALVDEIVGTGIALGASDIHIEHERRGVAVRYRVEGELRARPQPIPSEQGKPLVSRLKLLARLDITDTRRPQDGRIFVQVGKRSIDLRISTMPAKFGEKIVLRILDGEASIVSLKELILQDKVRQHFSEMVFRPNGLVLVTGPTGSGKTTTLYAALAARKRPELNVVTVEDPIEYHLDGITQVQVNPEVGTTFGAVLGALLRQDPDVILVGETRNAETAKMALEAAMTGHLVLTSLHTNGAVESVLRLTELGAEPYAVSNALLGVLHQRLVRRCCPSCTEPFEYPAPIVERLYKVGAFLPHERPTLARGRGCPRCNQTGFKGRVAIIEILMVNDAVRAAISAGSDNATLKDVARSSGAMVELARYAGIMVGTGVTVPGEVLHLLQK